MPSVTKCHCIRSPTDFSDAGFSSFERRDSGFESKMRARFGIESIHGTGWAVWTGKFGSLGVTGLKIPIGDPCIITILTCARIQLLVRIGSLGSCDNNDSCLRNVNNLSNKSPLQRLKWKKKKRFSWSFYVNHKNFFSKNVQYLAAILPNTLCKPIYSMSLWDGLRIPARGKYCPQDFPPATMNIIPDRLYCYRKHKETRAKRYS